MRQLLYLLHHSIRPGTVRSLPVPTAVEQTRALAAEGYREIVVTGIEISSWGQDLKNGETLIDLLEAVCTAAPAVRIRLGSLEPRTITEEFCRRRPPCRTSAPSSTCLCSPDATTP